MPRTIYILTIRDQSDFGALKHESAHESTASAYAYAETFAIPEVETRTDPEWHHSLESSVRKMDFFGEEMK